MSDEIRIKSALISVFHKEGLGPIIELLKQLQVTIYSTGGTAEFIRSKDVEVVEVADLTGYPSIFGGRVKTLHPKVHGGILARRGVAEDIQDMEVHQIPTIDLVIVDLYPFEETVSSTDIEEDIIEKIDIGGIALIRAAAKNFNDVWVIPAVKYYSELQGILQEHEGSTTKEIRKKFAGYAFDTSSHYDTQIFHYLNEEIDTEIGLKISYTQGHALRYGENPHQIGVYFGKLEEVLQQIHGKALSYNNLVDIDAALRLVEEFEDPVFAVIKHTNPCGCAIGKDLTEAWHLALAGDPVSAFGGVLACNGTVDETTAGAIDELFFEVLIARDFTPSALSILQSKKNRILLKWTGELSQEAQVKSVLNGHLVQTRDQVQLDVHSVSYQTTRTPTVEELKDIWFADTICKHLKSNAIAIVKNLQLIGSGIGQTSRIDAIKQAIQKAKSFNFDTNGAVLASDAFFPFADSVTLANDHGIQVIVEPGGSKRDHETIDYCEKNEMCLIFTSIRHFKH